MQGICDYFPCQTGGEISMRLGRDNSLIARINTFLYTPAYLLLVGVLTMLANIFSLELIAYTGFLFIAIYICLLGRDLLPLMPLFVCGYISPSLGSNPGIQEETVFSFSRGGLYLAIMLMLVAASLVYRLVTDPDFGGKKFLARKRELLSGMLLLGASYALSGLGSGRWVDAGWRNLLFAFLQLVAIAGLYYLLSGAVRWDLAPKAYLAWTGVCIGYVLIAELINIYITGGVIVDGAIFRNNIFTGWGHYNNMGALFTMVIPLPFFLTGRGRYAWFWYVSGIVFYLGLMFTCSRGSMLVGTFIFAASYILSLLNSRHARRQFGVHGTLIAIAIAAFIMREQLGYIFHSVKELGISSPVRLEIYRKGLQQFLENPVFGGSFFPVDVNLPSWGTSESFLHLFPPRWHNTLVQVLATGGLVCFVSYVIHRVQTIRLFVKQFSWEKLFPALSIAALLLTSMVDCHFFNIGPVLLYSATLAFTECRLNK